MRKIFSISIRIYHEDTDSIGFVYHGNYLKYMARARSEWLRHKGLELTELARDYDTSLIIRKVSVDFFRPAYLDDLLAVEVNLKSHSPVSLDFEQNVHRNGDDLVCRGYAKIVSIDANTQNLRRLPPYLIAKIT